MLRPLHNRVLIKPNAVSKKSDGGILMLSANVPNIGKVVGVGPGIYQEGKLIETVVRVGDKVMYVLDGGEDIDVDGDTFRIMTDEHIIGILT